MSRTLWWVFPLALTFLGGLFSGNTHNYSWGVVTDAVVMKDRGFGFVTMEEKVGG